MDIKVQRHHREIMRAALDQAREGRLHILDKMRDALPAPRAKHVGLRAAHSPCRSQPDKIRDVIGPGGKMIRSIIEKTGVKIDVEDDGTVNVASADEAAAARRSASSRS